MSAIIIAAPSQLPGAAGASTVDDLELPSMYAYSMRLARRFRDEHFAQVSASLAFTTLLSLVPLVTVVLIVASTFPLFATLVGQFDNFLVDNLLPGKTGTVVARYTLQFSEKARKLTVVGFGMLAVTSLLLLVSIERAFNHLWKVRKPRPFLQRLRLYAFVLVIGPLVAGAILASTTYAVTLSLGLFNEPLWVRRTVLKALAALLLCGFFAFLYYAVPNAKVCRRHALVGGAVAAAGVIGMQKLFEIYLTTIAVYTAVYGAFSALPILLVWLYACWAIVLVGALVVANFKPDGRRPPRSAAV